MTSTTSAPPRDIFVPGIGQYENIGDIILRRQLLRWLRPLGRLHVFVGPAHDGYEEALELDETDVAYASFVAWYLAGLRCAASGSASYMFKPGEIQLTLRGMKEHVSMLPLAALVRLRGGRVLRVGAGTRNRSALPRLIITPSLWLANRIWWRDAGTAAYLGHGEVMPDLAFGEGDPSDTALRPGARPLLVVSMRGDRPMVPAAWIDGLRRFAAAQGLSIHVVTQVARDAPRTAVLAAELGAEPLPWDGTGHARQEQHLRALYRRARIVVSDRLHVLISAYTHGAVPAAALNDSSDKIERHFAAAGIHDMSFEAAKLDADAIAGRLHAILDAGPGTLSRLPGVRAQLASVREQVTRLMTSGKPSSTAASQAR